MLNPCQPGCRAAAMCTVARTAAAHEQAGHLAVNRSYVSGLRSALEGVGLALPVDVPAAGGAEAEGTSRLDLAP